MNGNKWFPIVVSRVSTEPAMGFHSSGLEQNQDPGGNERRQHEVESGDRIIPVRGDRLTSIEL
jgi:hypothetical protein